MTKQESRWITYGTWGVFALMALTLFLMSDFSPLNHDGDTDSVLNSFADWSEASESAQTLDFSSFTDATPSGL